MNKDLRLLYILHILNDGYRTTVITILPFVAKDLSLSLTQIGVLGSSQTLIGTLLAIPAGYLASRLGGFTLLLTSLILYGLGFLSISFSPHFLTLLFAFYATAIGFAAFHPVSFVLVSRLSDPKSRGKNMGNFMSFGDIGRVIIPSLALIFIPFIGWRLAMAICALIAIILYAFSRFLIGKDIKPKTVEPQLPLSKREWLKSTLVLFHDGNLQRATLSAMGDTLASSNIYVYLPFLLLNRGINSAHLVFFTSAFFVGSLLGRSLLGRAVDIYGNKKVFILSEIAMMFTLFILVIFNNFFLFILIACILGIFTRGTSPVIQTLIACSIHEAHYEKVFGLSESLIQISGAATIFVSGLIADKFGINAVFYYSAILAILATLPIWNLKTKQK